MAISESLFRKWYAAAICRWCSSSIRRCVQNELMTNQMTYAADWDSALVSGSNFSSLDAVGGEVDDSYSHSYGKHVETVAVPGAWLGFVDAAALAHLLKVRLIVQLENEEFRIITPRGASTVITIEYRDHHYSVVNSTGDGVQWVMVALRLHRSLAWGFMLKRRANIKVLAWNHSAAKPCWKTCGLGRMPRGNQTNNGGARATSRKREEREGHGQMQLLMQMMQSMMGMLKFSG